jgi:hypothetical protein
MALTLPTTIFITYMFENEQTYLSGSTYGYQTPIHCAYIQKLTTDDYRGKKINFTFNENLFPFMKSSDDMNGLGWNANRIKALIQKYDYIDDTLVPSSDLWKVIDVTNQIPNYASFSATTINPNDLVGVIFSISDSDYESANIYDLSTYLNLPEIIDDNNKLNFGEETFFYGNITTDFNATIQRSSISIFLPLNTYNNSNNPTWQQNTPVYITEIGIYDDDNDLVAIAKLNYPIDKDNTKTRTFVFGMDF